MLLKTYCTLKYRNDFAVQKSWNCPAVKLPSGFSLRLRYILIVNDYTIFICEHREMLQYLIILIPFDLAFSYYYLYLNQYFCWQLVDIIRHTFYYCFWGITLIDGLCAFCNLKVDWHSSHKLFWNFWESFSILVLSIQTFTPNFSKWTPC